MTKTVVVTRAKNDGSSLCEALHTLGYRTIHEALTDIVIDQNAQTDIALALNAEPDAVIITSRHGARALASLSNERDTAIVCIGEASANAALSAGFTRVSVAGGSIDALASYLIDAYDNGARFLYISAKHIRSNPVEMLAPYGLHVQRIITYEAVTSPALSDTLLEQLKRGYIDAITFLSQRSAKHFSYLLQQAHMHKALVNIHAFCISGIVAKPLRPLRWHTIHIAPQATLASLVNCVDNGLRLQ